MPLVHIKNFNVCDQDSLLSIVVWQSHASAPPTQEEREGLGNRTHPACSLLRNFQTPIMQIAERIIILCERINLFFCTITM